MALHPEFPKSPPPARDSGRGGDLEYEECWTGGYIFENEWQSFRTRKNRDLELASALHTYTNAARYNVAEDVDDFHGHGVAVSLGVGMQR